MKTFVLFGIFADASKHPLALCSVLAETLDEAAEKLGGTLTNVGICDRRHPLRQVFVPDSPCAKFSLGDHTGEKYAEAVLIGLPGIPKDEASMMAVQMGPMLAGTYSQLVLGLIPTIS